MKLLSILMLVLLTTSLTIAVITPATWVDTSKVEGTLLFAGQDCKIGYGVACWGTAIDPCGLPVAVTIDGLPGATTRTDPNGYWAFDWRPTTKGIYYAVLTFASPAIGTPGGSGPRITIATVPVRVLDKDVPPVVTPGGCAVVK